MSQFLLTVKLRKKIFRSKFAENKVKKSYFLGQNLLKSQKKFF